jgi:colicin import membrane protein
MEAKLNFNSFHGSSGSPYLKFDHGALRVIGLLNSGMDTLEPGAACGPNQPESCGITAKQLESRLKKFPYVKKKMKEMADNEARKIELEKQKPELKKMKEKAELEKKEKAELGKKELQKMKEKAELEKTKQAEDEAIKLQIKQKQEAKETEEKLKAIQAQQDRLNVILNGLAAAKAAGEMLAAAKKAEADAAKKNAEHLAWLQKQQQIVEDEEEQQEEHGEGQHEEEPKVVRPVTASRHLSTQQVNRLVVALIVYAWWMEFFSTRFACSVLTAKLVLWPSY